MSLPLPAKVVLRWTRRVLVMSDEWLSVLTGGALNSTISLRAALAREQGSRAGCVLCRLLDVFQRDHCGIVLRKSRGQEG